jgi:hypothetical protein
MSQSRHQQVSKEYPATRPLSPLATLLTHLPDFFAQFMAAFNTTQTLRYGKPIHMEEYCEQFMSAVEGEPWLAVKCLMHRIEQDMVELTINAPDWETLGQQSEYQLGQLLIRLSNVSHA